MLNVDPYDMVFGFSITEVPVYKTQNTRHAVTTTQTKSALKHSGPPPLQHKLCLGKTSILRNRKSNVFVQYRMNDENENDYCRNDDYGFDYDDEDDQIHPNTMTFSKN